MTFFFLNLILNPTHAFVVPTGPFKIVFFKNVSEIWNVKSSIEIF